MKEMSSVETMAILTSSPSMQQEEEDTQYEVDDMVEYTSPHHHHLHHLNHPHNLSRLSMCSSNMKDSNSSPSSAVCDQGSDDNDITSSAGYGFGEDVLVNDGVVDMSRLSIDGSDNDGDEEFSDEEGNKERRRRMTISSVFSSDSDKENSCVSLPATPSRRRSHRSTGLAAGLKDYASENELQQAKGNKTKSRNYRRRSVRERWVEKCWGKKRYDNNNDQEMVECLVITRPKGGRKSLCMDKDEVKACQDLGFELEHGRVFEIPSRISISAGGSTIDTSSGGNSPIASWRISSPGDDPRDVKARLKVWAQAVALASTARSFS